MAANTKISALAPMSLLLILSDMSASLAVYIPFPTQRYYGTNEPSAELAGTHQWLYHNEPLDNDLWNSSLIQAHHVAQRAGFISYADAHAQFKRQALTPLHTVDSYLHIVSGSTSALGSSPDCITDAMIAAQFASLAQAYTNASITYRLLNTTRTTNDPWAANGDDLAMKTALRQGTCNALNIYYESQLQSVPDTPGISAGSTLLGFCSLPSAGVLPNTNPSVYTLDGCNMLSGTMPGGTFAGDNLGGITAHEVGHWNGLLHTVQDNSVLLAIVMNMWLIRHRSRRAQVSTFRPPSPDSLISEVRGMAGVHAH